MSDTDDQVAVMLPRTKQERVVQCDAGISDKRVLTEACKKALRPRLPLDGIAALQEIIELGTDRSQLTENEATELLEFIEHVQEDGWDPDDE